MTEEAKPLLEITRTAIEEISAEVRIRRYVTWAKQVLTFPRSTFDLLFWNLSNRGVQFILTKSKPSEILETGILTPSTEMSP